MLELPFGADPMKCRKAIAVTNMYNSFPVYLLFPSIYRLSGRKFVILISNHLVSQKGSKTVQNKVLLTPKVNFGDGSDSFFGVCRPELPLFHCVQVKIELPVHVHERHHILFTFYHVSCESSNKASSKKREGVESLGESDIECCFWWGKITGHISIR